jgi:hypothetical protein
VLAAEDVQRKIAVAAVIAVEKAAFLTTVQRGIRGVKIELDLLRRLVVRLQKQIHQQRIKRGRVSGVFL